MKKYLSLLLFIYLLNPLVAQVPLGNWRVHFPYHKNTTIAVVGSKIYCGSKSGMFTYNTDDGSAQRLSRTDGFSDVEVSLIRHSDANNCTVVIYENSNIDVIDHKQNLIFNIPDVFQKNMIGLKKINQLCFYEKKAYLACSFGIVVLDLEKKQVMDSYQNLGAGGDQLEFFSISIFNNSIYACAQNGILAASLNSNFLNSFTSWSVQKTSSLSNLSLVYKNNLYAIVDSVLQVYDGVASWTSYAPAAGLKINSMQISNGKLVIVTDPKIIVEDGLGQQIKTQTFKNEGVFDNRGFLVMVDNNYGLTIERADLGNSTDYFQPNGPRAKTFGKMTYTNGKLWVAGGSVNERWDPLVYNSSKFYTYSNNTWYNYFENEHPLIKYMTDFIDVKKNPIGSEIFISSYGSGIIEIVNDVPTRKYDETNSTLQRLSVPDSNYKPLLSGGMDFDNLGNLWVTNFGANKPLSVKTKSSWYSFGFGTAIGGANEVGWITCDDYNNKWIQTLRDKGILVFNDNGTPANANDDNYKFVTSETGKGALPSNTILCIAKDLRGEMWIGTSQGLTILSNPGNVFNTKNYSYDARPIIIKVGTNYEIFLGKEQINCIKVDPGNRKWIGTPNGAWLVSEDGYTVIKNFTTANSPLLSNNVLEIGIDEANGEVFFGTEKGIISYFGDGSQGNEDYSKVEIYPNPVRPEFTGQISVRGLMDHSTVKFTDISGNLVYETTSNGGFATWDGRSFNGKRVGTGVYLIFSANKDGSQNHVGKLLFVN